MRFLLLSALTFPFCFGCAVDPEPESLAPPLRGFVSKLPAANSSVDLVDPTPGIEPLGQADVESGHLMELVAYGDYVYVADSGGATIATARREPGGELTLVSRLDVDPIVMHTTIAVHEPSETLFAAAHDGPLAAYDISTPELPRFREKNLDWGYFRDIEVIGDQLLLTGFDNGLSIADIGVDGSLGPLSVSDTDDNVRFVTEVGDSLALLFADGRLELRRGRTTIDTIAVAGPALGLASDGERIAVALGSLGIQIVTADGDTLEVVQHLRPAGVVADVDIDGDIVAAFALNGIFAYELGAAGPRLFGFYPSGRWDDPPVGYVFSGEIFGDEVVASEWVSISRFRLDPSGGVRALDVQRGVYLGADRVLRFAARNVGKDPLEVHMTLRGEDMDLGRVVVPGESTLTIVPEHPELAAMLPRARVSVIDLEVVPPGSDIATQRTRLHILLRDEDHDPSTGRPAPNDPFPQFGVRWLESREIEAVPQLGSRTRVVFYSIGCAAMWAELGDATWLAERGMLDDGATLLLASAEDEERDYMYSTRWALDPARSGFYMEPAPSALLEMNAGYGSGDLYFDAFFVDLPGDAQPTDYLVDTAGRVLAVERMYRGLYPLRPSN